MGIVSCIGAARSMRVGLVNQPLRGAKKAVAFLKKSSAKDF
jgi:hypothetical protein